MRRRSKFGIGVLVSSFAGALVLCLVLREESTRAQQVAGMEATDFKVQLENYPPPNEAQTKTLLEGAKAQPQSEGQILLTEAKLKTFSTNGVLGLIAHAPQCIFDSMQRTISSTGRLHVQTADGRFTLEGEGFSLQQGQQTNTHLLISNRVHTVIVTSSGKPLKP
jgi:hypothetical protein